MAETHSQCPVALDQGYVGEAEMEAVKSQADLVWKKINGFVACLNRSKQGKR